MAREQSTGKTREYPGRLAEKQARGIGQGPQKDPTKGTQNPLTQNLKTKEPPGSAKTAEG